MSGRVLLFGLDGATFTVLDDLVKRGVMPYLGRFMAEGARGPLMSTIPPLTPPAWITLVTGRSPGVHGITNFLQYESDDSRYVRVVSSRQICAETIWSIVGRQGLRAGTLNFVAHSPPPKINGYVIPGWVPWRWVKKHSRPAGLVDRLKTEIPGFDVKELAMNFDEEEKAISGATHEDYEPWIDLHIRRERQWFHVLRHQMEHDPCELTAIVFDGVDKLQHLLWQYLDPAREPSEPSDAFIRTRKRCWDYFRQLDDFLAESVALAGSDAHVLVASDHGFTGTTKILYMNTWLEREGYLTWAPGTAITPHDSQILGDGQPRHLTAFDLSKTRAFAASASNNGIQIPIAGIRGSEGISACEYESFREELIDASLTRCVDPDSGEPLIDHVWTREEIFAGPKMDLAPDLTVSLRDAGFFSVFRANTVVRPRPVVMGTHHPQGVFLAHGPGVRQGVQLEPLHLLDIAPTLLYLLGLPVPEDLEGRVALEVFSPEYVESCDWSYGPATAGAGVRESPDGGGVMEKDEEGNAQVLMRLRALGYIE